MLTKALIRSGLNKLMYQEIIAPQRVQQAHQVSDYVEHRVAGGGRWCFLVTKPKKVRPDGTCYDPQGVNRLHHLLLFVSSALPSFFSVTILKIMESIVMVQLGYLLLCKF
ncbi:hypothetical protein L1987_86200 [Smallanthus sonchifolius]|uniref:Uncharacterized protein n=1 Tax=Smallanthus sonchifolius TaxID=185202 RepID=A0ACB8XZ38_9ASTR|nr:hypothetical protein L1987_86200 [Smallanthus sonchifolius]